MEDKKQIKISLKAVISICLIVLVLGGVLIWWLKNQIKRQEPECIEKTDLRNEEYMTVDKPILYLYPQEEMGVKVKLGYPKEITCSYPTYQENGWSVKAKPNGDLTDMLEGKELYALYYESRAKVDFKVGTTGFIVKGEDSAQFLEEKLAILGLTPKEIEEFIIYWLPKLEQNNYNYIRFATQEEIEKNMPLTITPKPNTIIRVLMMYKGFQKEIPVEEQELVSPIREGFVAVEWGGIQIK